MIYKHGAHSHAQDEVSTVFEQRANFTPRGDRKSVTKRIKLSGKLHAADVTALTAALGTLRTAYESSAGDNVDSGLYENDGTTVTDHFLDSSASLGGVRVVQPPTFAPGDGAEYTTFRSWTAVVEAEFRESSITDDLIAFQESITIIGTGGPRFVILETLNGPPVKQQVNLVTKTRAVQTGQALGLLAYPTAPNPFSPTDEHVDQRQPVNRGPMKILGTQSEFGISWSYTFESIGVLSGTPNTGGS